MTTFNRTENGNVNDCGYNLIFLIAISKGSSISLGEKESSLLRGIIERAAFLRNDDLEFYSNYIHDSNNVSSNKPQLTCSILPYRYIYVYMIQ